MSTGVAVGPAVSLALVANGVTATGSVDGAAVDDDPLGACGWSGVSS